VNYGPAQLQRRQSILSAGPEGSDNRGRETMAKQNRSELRVNRLLLTAYVNRVGEEQKTPVLMGRTFDISSSGIGMIVYQEVVVGSTMELEIDLHDSLLAIKGTVLHVRKNEDGSFQIGIGFNESQPQLSGLHLS
jgi:PilZ domain